jgi:predicted transcriptional regulator
MAAEDGTDIVILSVEAYQELLAKLDRAEALVGIYRGQEDIRNGRTLPLDEAFRRIRERARERESLDEHVDLEAIAAIQEGLDEIARGGGRPAREALAEIRARVEGEQAG